jgi:hypothetical protein
MRISEILFWNNEPTEEDRAYPLLNSPPASSNDSLTNLAMNAFTRSGLVKGFWNMKGSEEQPSGPAPPDTGTELIPRGTLEPTAPSWQAEPGENDPTVGRRRLGKTEGHQATDFAHLIDTTARPRAPQPRHRTRSVRSSTLSRGLRPSRDRNAIESTAVCEHAAQSTFTKSPGPRSSMQAA